MGRHSLSKNFCFQRLPLHWYFPNKITGRSDLSPPLFPHKPNKNNSPWAHFQSCQHYPAIYYCSYVFKKCAPSKMLCTKTFSPSRLSLPWKHHWPLWRVVVRNQCSQVQYNVSQLSLSLPGIPVPGDAASLPSELSAGPERQSPNSGFTLNQVAWEQAAKLSPPLPAPSHWTEERKTVTQIKSHSKKINSFHLVLFCACFHSVIMQKDTTYCMVLLISKPHSCTGRPQAVLKEAL